MANVNNQLVANGNNVQMATNNPTNNVQMAMNNSSNNVSQVQSSPVTIPIQFQPVVASSPTMQSGNVSQVPTPQAYSAPTPVSYQQSSYSAPAYQSSFDNYKSQYSDIKYPEITIPTNTNTIEGQYKSNYSDAINQIASSILNSRFSYNPNEDDLLKQASQYVTQNTFEAMNSKGILNSSMTAERVAQVVR